MARGNWRIYTKMFVAGSVCVIGGPAFTMWLTPTEEELFKKYNPELQKRSLERRDQTQAEFDAYVNKLKEYSRSNKPIWSAWEEELAKKKDLEKIEQLRKTEEMKLQQEAMRREAGIVSK
ncbi:CBP4 domain-containing protein [Plectosphaerella cucumerina]|uniref:Cytochrome b mRNA-processing protein 4 n=1 Tax=Plectosphaerella cucumerina TaxID=40658 RepID=A0A8K0TDG1_9PEZI|nr:CBP4 domain-containing protein [Plectosphaerella cucumerina]